MTLTFELDSELEDRLCDESKRLGVEPDEVVRRLIQSAIPQPDKWERAIALLDQWENEGDEEEQRDTLEALKQGLNAHHSSGRTIFP